MNCDAQPSCFETPISKVTSANWESPASGLVSSGVASYQFKETARKPFRDFATRPNCDARNCSRSPDLALSGGSRASLTPKGRGVGRLKGNSLFKARPIWPPVGRFPGKSKKYRAVNPSETQTRRLVRFGHYRIVNILVRWEGGVGGCIL